MNDSNKNSSYYRSMGCLFGLALIVGIILSIVSFIFLGVYGIIPSATWVFLLWLGYKKFSIEREQAENINYLRYKIEQDSQNKNNDAVNANENISTRYIKIFTFNKNLYADGSPLIIQSGVLDYDSNQKQLIGKLKFLSVTNHLIKTVKVEIVAFDKNNRAFDPPFSFEYLYLMEERDNQFGIQTPIVFPMNNATSFSVRVTKVLFENNECWDGSSANWYSIPTQEPLKLWLTNQCPDKFSKINAILAYEKKFGRDKNLVANIQPNWWLCSCGAFNLSCEPNCHKCNASLEELRALNVEDLWKNYVYNQAVEALQSKSIREVNSAIHLLSNIPDYRDSNDLLASARSLLEAKEAEATAEKIAEKESEPQKTAKQKRQKSPKKST